MDKSNSPETPKTSAPSGDKVEKGYTPPPPPVQKPKIVTPSSKPKKESK